MSLLQNKRFRGTVKLFFPYFIQAAYVRRIYGIDPAPAWYNRKSFASRLLYLLAQPLPYGAVASTNARKTVALLSPGRSSFSITRLHFEINEEASLTPELVADIHRRVLEGLYPRPDQDDPAKEDEEEEAQHE